MKATEANHGIGRLQQGCEPMACRVGGKSAGECEGKTHSNGSFLKLPIPVYFISKYTVRFILFFPCGTVTQSRPRPPHSLGF